MLLFAVALAALIAEQVAPTPSQKELYRKSSGRCLADRAEYYLDDHDIIGKAKLLAKECMSYMPVISPCPDVSEGFTAEYVAQCEAEDERMKSDIRSTTENTAVRMIEIARRRRDQDY